MNDPIEILITYLSIFFKNWWLLFPIFLVMSISGAQRRKQEREYKRQVKEYYQQRNQYFQHQLTEQRRKRLQTHTDFYVSPEVQKRAATVFQGNWNQFSGLLSLSKKNNPGRPEQWHWEKVIWDLERDRY